MPSPRGKPTGTQRPQPPPSVPFCCAVQPSAEKTVIRGPEPQPLILNHLPRTEVLRHCLALDDVALSWVCDQLLRIRTQIYEQVYLSNCKPATLPAEETEAAPDPAKAEPGKEPKDGLGAVAAGDGDMSYIEPAISKEPPRRMSVRSDQDLQTESLGLRKRIRERDKELHGEVPTGQAPTIQFEAAMYYCLESDPTVEIDIIRIGDISRNSTVKYATRDLSAKAGIKYEAQSGILEFQKGERHKHISIVTIDDDAWDATLEFVVELTEDGLKNGILGRYLWVTRVKIIDDDYFPSNRYSAALEQQQYEKLNKPVLMYDFFRMNLRNPVVRKGIIRTMLSDQLQNCYFILGLFLNLYMVDHVLCEECDESNATQSLLYIVMALLIPFPVIHWLEFREAYWKVGGATRLTLQSNLLRKYLNYDADSLQHIEESRLVLAMTRDAFELARDAFGKLAPLVGALSRLFVLVVYQIVTPLAFGEDIPPLQKLAIRFGPAIVFPVLMLGFLLFRNALTMKYLEMHHKSQNDMIHHVNQALSNFDVLRDYKKRGWCIDQFEDKVKKFNADFADSNAIGVNNKMFPLWVTLCLTAAYIVIGGAQVSAKSIPIGEFLNYIAIFNALGLMWGKVYEILIFMQNAFDALESITEYMNLPTENSQRLYTFANNLDLCKNAKKQRSLETDEDDPADAIPIELRDLTFQYKSTGNITCALERSSVMLPQGGLYTLVGPPSQGKGTILKLLGEVLIPFVPHASRNSAAGGGGDLMVPSHLRALHVSKEPVFVEGSLMMNLCFGVAAGKVSEEDGNKARVLNICRKLNVSPTVIETLESEATGSERIKWSQVLSSTEAALLHLARALIANPELLCLHKPALYLNEAYADTTYKVLKEFVENRGLELNPAEFHMRRPRTCIVTARRAQGAGAAMADAVYRVTQEDGIVLVI